MGKAMGSGFPISAVVGRAEMIDAVQMPGQLFTLQGNAVCAAAALATIDVIRNENLLSNADIIGSYIKDSFEKISQNSKIIKDIRGLGASIGVELEDPDKTIDTTDVVKKICYRCFEKGLILIYLGSSTLRVQPPLIMKLDEAKTAMDIIEEVFEEYKNNMISDTVLEKMRLFQSLRRGADKKLDFRAPKGAGISKNSCDSNFGLLELQSKII